MSSPSWRAAWGLALAAPRFRTLAITAPFVVTGVLVVFRRFLDAVEKRPGAVLADPILPHIPMHQAALLVFTIMYVGLAVGLAALARTPERFVAGLWGYAAMIAVRMAAMYMLPLDPPPTMVLLRDPLVDLFGDAQTLTRDLFFSGHTATMFLLALANPGRRAKIVLYTATFAVAMGVLVHHAHYAVDVLIAPFVSYACWRAGRRLVGVT